MCQGCAELGQCFWVYFWVISPFSLLVLSKVFSLCHLDCSSPSNPLSWPITRWSELQLSVSTICVPVPSWLCPAVPSAAMPPAPPPPCPSPPWGQGIALDLLRAGAARLLQCPCAGTV